MGFAAESCVNSACSLLGKAGEGSITGPEHNTSELEEEDLNLSSGWLNHPPGFHWANNMSCSNKMWFDLFLYQLSPFLYPAVCRLKVHSAAVRSPAGGKFV